MYKHSKKAVATLGVLAVGSFGLVAMAPAAQAGEVTTTFLCKTENNYNPDMTGTFPITITSPATAAPGATVPITADFKDGIVGTFPDIAAGIPLSISTSLSIKVSNGAAAAGTATVKAPDKAVTPAKGEQMKVGQFTGTWTAPTAAGKYDFSADILNIATSIGGGALIVKTTCTPTSGTGVSSSTEVKTDVPQTPSVTLTPNKGKVGTDVTVKGVNLPANTDLFAAAVDAAGAPLGSPVPVKSGADGTATATVKVTDPKTASIGLGSADGAVKAGAAFTVETDVPTNPGDLVQKVGGEIKAGNLSMTQAGEAIKLSDITLNGQAQNMTGKLNQVTVSDMRASSQGWSLTAKATDFTSATGGTISKDNFTWTPTCVAADGSPGKVTAGTAGKVDASTLCKGTDGEAGAVTGGKFTADADVKLAVPAFPAAGVYTSTITLSLS